MKQIQYGLYMCLWMTLILGVAYPLIVLIVSQVIFNDQANGSILTKNNRIVGSRMIAQNFERLDYFWPRPSAVNYDPLPSGASNLGPTSAELRRMVQERRDRILSYDGSSTGATVPSEMLYASASGLDPHISAMAAYYQAERVARARGYGPNEMKELKDLIERTTYGRRLGYVGAPYVNVLRLNLALDAMEAGWFNE